MCDAFGRGGGGRSRGRDGGSRGRGTGRYSAGQAERVFVVNGHIDAGYETVLFIVDGQDRSAHLVTKFAVYRVQTWKIDVEAAARADARRKRCRVAQGVHERLGTGNNHGGGGGGHRL